MEKFLKTLFMFCFQLLLLWIELLKKIKKWWVDNVSPLILLLVFPAIIVYIVFVSCMFKQEMFPLIVSFVVWVIVVMIYLIFKFVLPVVIKCFKFLKKEWIKASNN